jgi:SAM-dependent methyltransferase
METAVPSPVTGGTSTHCDQFLVKPIVDRYRSDWGLDVADDLRNWQRLDVFRCDQTGYRFFHPPGLAGEADFYNRFWALEDPQIHRPEDAWRDDWQFALEQLEAGDRVLDVGCAEGAFIARGIAIANIEGIDENAEGCKIALARGLKVSCISAAAFAKERSNFFDKVIASQVLEHVYDVGAFIQALKGLLRPGGEMILSVPNNEPYYAGWAKYEPLNNPPHHIGLWNERSLREMANHVGLDVKKVAYLGEPDPFHFQVYRRAAYLSRIRRGPRHLTKHDWRLLTLSAPIALILTLARKLNGSSFAHAYLSVILRKPVKS